MGKKLPALSDKTHCLLQMSVGDVQSVIRALAAREGEVLDVPRAGCRHRAPAALGRNVCLGSATGVKPQLLPVCYHTIITVRVKGAQAEGSWVGAAHPARPGISPSAAGTSASISVNSHHLALKSVKHVEPSKAM